MMTAGGMAVFGVGLLVGYEAANMTGRYFEGIDPSVSPAPALPSGITTIAQYNELVQAAPPSLKKTFIELAIAAVGFAIGVFAPGPLLKLFGYGWGFGGLAHIGGALLDGYVIRPMFTTTTAATATTPATSTPSNLGQRMYQHEATAASAATAAKTAGGATLGAPAPGMQQRGGTQVRRQPQGVMLAQMQPRNPFRQMVMPAGAQPNVQIPAAPGTSLTVPAGWVSSSTNLPRDNGDGTQTCPNGQVLALGANCQPPGYLTLGDGFVQSSTAPVPQGATVTLYWYPNPNTEAPPTQAQPPPPPVPQPPSNKQPPYGQQPPPCALPVVPQMPPAQPACGDPPDDDENGGPVRHPLFAMRAGLVQKPRSPFPTRRAAA